MASLTLGSRSFSAWSGRSLVLGVVGSETVSVRASATLPKTAAKHLDAVLPALDVSAKVAATTTLPAVPGLKADTVVLVGLGGLGEDDAGTDALRRAAGAAVRAAGTGSVALALPHADEVRLAAIAEGAVSGSYTFTAHKSAPEETDEREVTVFSDLGRKASPKDVLDRATTVSRNVAWARDLVNTPPNLLYPQSFTEQVQQVAKASSGKLTVKVLDEK
ncbi:MAG: M17 family peptidase N-terminal domain-containing protein, partial [Janibacter sp.]